MRSILFGALACVLVLGTIACAREDLEQPSPDVAFKEMGIVLDELEAPEDKVPILEAFIAAYPGDPVSLSSMTGQVMVLSFWNPG